MSEPRQRAGRPHRVIGWDIGGAHVKACLTQDGAVRDVAQWPCALWQGLHHLDEALRQAQARWPQAGDAAVHHAVTMTGEMVDLFADRREGVVRLAAHLAGSLGGPLRLYAGAHGWVDASRAADAWEAIASANWRATAQWLARCLPDAVLVDIGSTTTDLIPIRGGRVAATGASDAQRLGTGELVYQGVVRTPLCALAQRVPFDGGPTNVMNELFATTADVYRLTGELDARHDQHPAADNGAKDATATCRRLARMIGRDVQEADAEQWLQLAQAWRAHQLDEIGGQLDRVVRAQALAAAAPIVGAGCGDFLAAALAGRHGRAYRRFVDAAVPLSAHADDATAAWAQVCAPAVAVALLAAD